MARAASASSLMLTVALLFTACADDDDPAQSDSTLSRSCQTLDRELSQAWAAAIGDDLQLSASEAVELASAAAPAYETAIEALGDTDSELVAALREQAATLAAVRSVGSGDTSRLVELVAEFDAQAASVAAAAAAADADACVLPPLFVDDRTLASSPGYEAEPWAPETS